MPSYFKFPLLVILWMVALMSGAFSIFRELYGIYSGVVPPRSLFWSCTWMAFVVTATILWVVEHKARVDAEKRLNDEEPKIVLALLSQSLDWTQLDTFGEHVFSLTNNGKRAANFVQIEPVKSVSEKYTLSFEGENLRPDGHFRVITHSINDGYTNTTLGKRSLWEFLHNCPLEQQNETFEIVIRFHDMQTEKRHTARMMFDLTTKKLEILPH